MSILSSKPCAETRIVIPNVAWDVFESLAASDCAGTRFTYDKGLLEITSPSIEHEWCHRILGQIVQVITDELNIPRLSAGSKTALMPSKTQASRFRFSISRKSFVSWAASSS